MHELVMKRFFLVFNFLFITICNSYNIKKPSLIGKWQLVETYDSDGVKGMYTPVQNGRIIIFEKRNVVSDGFENKGSYEVHKDHLRISFLQDEFYRFGFSDDKPDKLYLSPRTSKYKIICDEGCSEIYQKM